MRMHIYLHVKNRKYIHIMPPDFTLRLTLISLNYPCFELIFIVPKVFEPLKFDCNIYKNFHTVYAFYKKNKIFLASAFHFDIHRHT